MASERDSHSSDAQKGEDATYVLDERRRAALADVDNAKFSCVSWPVSKAFLADPVAAHRWFHVKVAMVAGVGFFTDACVLAFCLQDVG